MTNTITFFDKYQDLCKLTGAQSHKELWDAGFDLDDWDFGFASDKPWSEINGPYYQMWLLLHMGNYCIGYKHVEFSGRYYYIVYHS